MPHILDHVQVNCLDGLRIKLRDDKRMKDLWMKLCNAGNHILKNDAVRRIPKKWKELKEILMAMETPKIDLETVFDKGSRVGCPEDECVSMLKFFHAIGDIVFYEDLDGLVVLHPEWLANQLKKVVTYQNHDLVQEGRITLKKARESWTYMDENEQLQLLCLFENMGLSVKMPDNSYLFPCLLPLGQPCERRWPIYPEENERQLSYLIQFNFIPITFFSRLIIRIETEKDRLVRTWEPEYYASTILFDYKGRPNWCEVHTTEYEAIQKKMDLYRVRIKLNSRKRTLHVTVRGATPCCTFQHVKKGLTTSKMYSIQSCK